MPRLLIISNSPTPNNDALFAEIARRPEIELRVLYGTMRESHRRWTLDAAKDYAYEVLPGRTFAGTAHLNSGLPRAIARFRPEIAILTGSYTMPTLQLAVPLLRRRRVPALYWGEELSHDTLPAHRRLLRGAMRAMLRRVYGVLAIGTRARASYARAGVPNDRIADFRYYADTDRFHAAAAAGPAARADVRARLGLAADDVGLLYCGQFIRRKRIDTALRAMHRLGDRARRLRLILVGDGVERDALAGEAASLGLADRVQFAGFIEPSALPPVFAACDALVLPSEQEGWGVVVGEALAAGLPVFASERVNAAHDLVRDGESGWRFPLGDDAALGTQLGQYMESAERRATMSRAATEAVCRESPRFAAQRLVSLLDATCRGEPLSTL